jgi:phenylacetate-CoA ligase
MTKESSSLNLSPVCSAVQGIAWPGIPQDNAAQLLAACFQLERSQWWTAKALQDHQLRQLQLVLRHALATVPYYAESFRGLDVDSLDWAGFLALPHLQRNTLQAEFDALISRQCPKSHGNVTPGQSSGSTGKPVRFLLTAVSQLFWKALTLREHLWHNRNFAGKFSAIRVKIEDGHSTNWGPPVGEVFQTGPSVMLNVRADTAKQLEWLQREDPDYLITHASNLGALAELSIQRGVKLQSLRQARTFSETLRPDLRDRVRKAWGVEIADVYSCEEAGVIAFQCPLHEHYHVQAENLIVEVLHPDGTECMPGETGEVVLTTLHNFAMPLIRYRIGDYAEVGGACSCGRGLPVLKRIHGRQRNMLTLPDGSQHWPSFPSALWLMVAPIQQFRVIQTAPNCLEVTYAMDRALTTAEEVKLKESIGERLGYVFEIAWNHVDAIERTPNAKYEDFVSQLCATEQEEYERRM